MPHLPDDNADLPSSVNDETSLVRRSGFIARRTRELAQQVRELSVSDNVEVVFEDENLEAALRTALEKREGPLTRGDLKSLDELAFSYLGIGNLRIENLFGLEHATNLTELKLELIGNPIRDLSPLASLTNLTLLDLRSNPISDISPLASLTNLTVEPHLRQPKKPVTAKQVDWEILPPGWWRDPRHRQQLESQFRDKEQAQLFLQRLEYLDTFNPKQVYRSRFKDQGSVYYAYVFAESVVAENPLEGNAIYVIRGLESWQSLLKLSKETLRQRYPTRVKRIVHRGDWKARLQREIL